ncbi:D-alanine--D-alanine ligase [subsurface metagenome]
MSAKKIRLLVLFGGVSGEHQVSLVSAKNVISAADRMRYEIIPLLITKEGRWFSANDPTPLLEGDTSRSFAVCLPADPGEQRLHSLEGKELPQYLAHPIDCAFPVLHGPNGEDGTIQGLLSLAQIPYVGAGVLSSALLMDKGYMKLVFQDAGLPMVPHQVHSYHRWEDNRQAVIEQIERDLPYPLFTKPCNLGSSVGISRAGDRDGLVRGLEDAFSYDNRVIVEKGVDARELECSVLGNINPRASILGEIVPSNEFYDYAAKYIDDNSELIIPAPIDDSLMKLGQELAVKAFVCAEGRGMGRVDFLLDKYTGELFLNEINTIPGFTPISMYPKLWQESGLSYPRLIDELVQLAQEEFESHSRLKKSYTPN